MKKFNAQWAVAGVAGLMGLMAPTGGQAFSATVGAGVVGEEKLRLAGSLEEAKADLLFRFKQGIEEASAKTKAPVASDVDNMPGFSERSLVTGKDLKRLATRLNEESEDSLTDATRLYMKAAGGFLEDSDPTISAMACVFLGMMKTHLVEAGLAPELGKRLDDSRTAFKEIYVDDFSDVPQQQALVARPPRFKPVDLTVGQIAQRAFHEGLGMGFEKEEEFNKFWKTNSDYEKRLWYWALRWNTPRVVERDLPKLFEKDAKGALRTVILAWSSAAVDVDAHLNVAASFDWPRDKFVADLAAKHKVRDMLLTMAAGDFGELKLHESDQESLVRSKVFPLMEELWQKGDVKELVELLEKAPGLIGKRTGTRVELTRVIARKDPKNAADVIRGQMALKPGLATLAGDLVKLTGDKDWERVKETYLNPDKESEYCGGVEYLVSSLALAEGGKAKLAELLEADPLDIELDERGMPGGKRNQPDCFDAFLRTAKQLNGNVDVVSNELAGRARAYHAGKATAEQYAEQAMKNREAVGARKEAVAILKRYFSGK